MANILETSMDYLAQFDPEIASQMQSEYQRQQRNIELIASENIASPAVIAAMGSVLTASWTYYGAEDNSTILYGTKGIMRIYDDPNYSIVVIGRDGEKTLYEIDKIQTNDNQTSSGVIDLWVKCLKEQTPPEISGEEALDAMKAVFAALESAQSGKTVQIEEVTA